MLLPSTPTKPSVPVFSFERYILIGWTESPIIEAIANPIADRVFMNFVSPFTKVFSFTDLPAFICSLNASFTLFLLNESETIYKSFNSDFKLVLLTLFLSTDSRMYSLCAPVLAVILLIMYSLDSLEFFLIHSLNLVSLFKELSRDFATSSIVSLDILTYPSASRPTASGLYTFTFSKVCLI